MEKPDIVCITETWFCDDIVEAECTIRGYTCVRCYRNRHGGGVALFISNKLEFNTIMAGPNELELLLVSIQNANDKVYIGLWYRPPANFESLDALYCIWKVWISDFYLVLYFCEILMLTFIIISIHFFISYPEFCI